MKFEIELDSVNLSNIMLKELDFTIENADELIVRLSATALFDYYTDDAISYDEWVSKDKPANKAI